jgi:hypothetical protein
LQVTLVLYVVVDFCRKGETQALSKTLNLRPKRNVLRHRSDVPRCLILIGFTFHGDGYPLGIMGEMTNEQNGGDEYQKYSRQGSWMKDCGS